MDVFRCMFSNLEQCLGVFVFLLFTLVGGVGVVSGAYSAV